MQHRASVTTLFPDVNLTIMIASVKGKYCFKQAALEDDIEQVKFDINHKLRARVATIIGATNIIPAMSNDDLNKIILPIIKQSSKELNILTEEIIDELSKVLTEIRNRY